ncbi:class I SAM-dependent methyltransferase [Microbacterium sp. 179-I 3D4 NHS]|uniref:class I SAM-dependent methyltransferase n=1 Tax=Microbacterium sp. 179-I 3D4 NHS TaxID=3142381 RepID=UPI00399EFB40
MVDQALARAFEGIGEEYDRYRPGFPVEALDVLMPLPVAAVLDLGAGTGKLTERLVERSADVIAVEPSRAMLDVLRKRLPHVEARIGSAEAIPVADASVQLVTVAQAFHWFERDAACAEIARVLAPWGALGLLWNHSDPRCAWDVACHRVAHPAVGTDDRTTQTAADDLPGFEFLRRVELAWTEEITRDDYLRRWGTISSFLVAEPAQRGTMVAALERILDEDADTRGRERFELPHLTEIFVYRRA